tara:strand:+ start:495 stop:893 length:399 start_codon:yes stop_codon:yes gene_type:complete
VAQQGFQMSQKMSLNQVLAPQLQQSLNLLQAPMLELKAMVDQELQLNPVLEEQAALDAEAREKGEPVEGDEAKVDLAEPPSDTQYDSHRREQRRGAGGRFPEGNQPVDRTGSGVARPLLQHQHPVTQLEAGG